MVGFMGSISAISWSLASSKDCLSGLNFLNSLFTPNIVFGVTTCSEESKKSIVPGGNPYLAISVEKEEITAPRPTPHITFVKMGSLKSMKSVELRLRRESSGAKDDRN